MDTTVPDDATVFVAGTSGTRSPAGRDHRAGDRRAVGVLRAVRRQGLRPVADVAVTGVDDPPPTSGVDGSPTAGAAAGRAVRRTEVDVPAGANGDRGTLLTGEVVGRASAPVRLGEQDVDRWESP
ncbi:hypothetical protein [Saccharothrix longispora]|uniref:hypothetical protein n=1 Tax=Saccharothrix longispora TaxID=33920 RepID=UPI0028FD5AC6|nr:hypothetical protein [Saccharothrix longispora]MDU0292283.1 hypothetical protein [Saccharothrix longispora]